MSDEAQPGGEHDDPLVGQLLSCRYAILRAIDRRENLIVYKANDQSNHVMVTVKTLKYFDPEAAAEIRQQYGKLAALRHENIAPVYEYFETKDGRPFIVTEYMRGISLKEVLESDGFVEGEEEIVDLLRPVANALAFAHEHGIYHGNIHPDSIFLWEEDGHVIVKVADFGLAKACHKLDHAVTATNNANDENAKRLIDIFQLGVLAYLIATGELPYKGKSLEELLLVPSDLHSDPDPVSYHRSDLYCVNDFSQLIDESIELDLEWRIESMTEFLDGLKKWIDSVEAGKIIHSQLIEQITDGSVKGQKSQRNKSEKDMRTTIRNMVKLRLSQSTQENTLIMKLAKQVAAEGPRRSPLATMARLVTLLVSIALLALSVIYLSTAHPQKAREIWMQGSRSVSSLFYRGPKQDEVIPIESELPSAVATSGTGKKKTSSRSLPAIAFFTKPAHKSYPRTTPETIRFMYSKWKPGGIVDNNTRMHAKIRGFRIDYEKFNPDWLKQ